MWIYEQRTGRMLHYNEVIGIGYSGRGDGLNNPAMQNVQGVGPIPCGYYTMQVPRIDPKLGQFVMALIPFAQNEMFGRFAFDWHGDEIAHAGEHLASDGCIINSRDVREQGWNGGDHIIQVITGEPT